MKRLTHWSIEERKEWRLSNISAVSYRISGCIYGHESIKDGESFRSGSDIQGMVVSADEVIVRTEHSVYYCKLQDAFWSRMDKSISWLFGAQALELNEGLTVTGYNP